MQNFAKIKVTNVSEQFAFVNLISGTERIVLLKNVKKIVGFMVNVF